MTSEVIAIFVCLTSNDLRGQNFGCEETFRITDRSLVPNFNKVNSSKDLKL